MWLPKQLSQWFLPAIDKGLFKDHGTICFCIDLSNSLYHLFATHDGSKYTVHDPISQIQYSIDAYITLIRGLAHYIGWAKSVNLKCKIVLFADLGRSNYHYNIFPSYKIRRHIRTDAILYKDSPSVKPILDYVLNDDKLRQKYKLDDINNLTLDAINETVRRLVISTIDKTVRYLPNVYLIILDNLEADFIPYFISRSYLAPEIYNTIGADLFVTVSSDSDMFQNITSNHCIISSKYNILTKKNVARYLELTKQLRDGQGALLSQYYTLYKSLVGDTADSIPGVYRIGVKGAIKILEECASYIKSNNITCPTNNLLSDKDVIEYYTSILSKSETFNKLASKAFNYILKHKKEQSNILRNPKLYKHMYNKNEKIFPYEDYLEWALDCFSRSLRLIDFEILSRHILGLHKRNDPNQYYNKIAHNILDKQQIESADEYIESIREAFNIESIMSINDKLQLRLESLSNLIANPSNNIQHNQHIQLIYQE